jgi:hypothetical protein
MEDLTIGQWIIGIVFWIAFIAIACYCCKCRNQQPTTIIVQEQVPQSNLKYRQFKDNAPH